MYVVHIQTVYSTFIHDMYIHKFLHSYLSYIHVSCTDLEDCDTALSASPPSLSPEELRGGTFFYNMSVLV